MLATNGDTFLGGEDFDIRLIDYLVDEVKKESGMNLKGDPLAMLLDSCRRYMATLGEKRRSSMASTMPQAWITRTASFSRSAGMLSTIRS